MKYTKFGFLFVLSISLFFGGTMYVRGAHFGALLQPGMSIEDLLGGLFPPGFGFAAKDTINSTKTVSWSKSYSGKALVTHAILSGSWWAPALWSPNVSVLYKASANKVGEGTSLSVGDKITFMPGPFLDTDTSWNGTGYGWDSPYGHFVPSAGDPGLSCAAGDYVNDDTSYASWPLGGFVPYNVKIYIPLSVNIPVATFSPTNGMTCDSRSADGSTTCTINQAGTVSGTMTFPANYGKFYYAYISALLGSGCYRSDVPLRNYSGVAWTSCNYISGCPAGSVGSEFSVDIPQQTIAFSFTAAAGALNHTPTIPVVTPRPFNGNTNTVYPFTFKASDPDGDLIRYAIDWNNDWIVDEYTSYTTSGSSLSASNTIGRWPTTGVKYFQVRTEDSKGSFSPWANPIVSLNAAQNGACGSATLIASGPAPVIGLCSIGTATLPVMSGSNWTWSCNGLGGGESIACTTPVQTYTLTVTKNPTGTETGNGIITDTTPTGTSIDSGAGRNTESVPYNSSRTLRATPTSSSISWSGCTSVSGNDCIVNNIIADKTVTATFTRLPEPGICGSSNTQSFETLTAGSSGLCSSGAVSGFSLSGTTYSWNCNGSFGSPIDVSCSASQIRNYNWIETAP
ncbi:MAG: hypothetical protein KA034_01820 [Candidatus Moranbacteria bacterium]|nr:hypothetical protein [Candidatus Moranbacteria bacterium]